MSKKRAKEICKNLYTTILNMKDTKIIHNVDMFKDRPVRPTKSTFKRIYNKLIKKYEFRRRQL